MDELEKQIFNSCQRAVLEFNSLDGLAEIRKLYRQNFELIAGYITRLNPRLAIEDISNLNSNLSSIINAHFHLLKEVNLAIQKGILSVNGIK